MGSTRRKDLFLSLPEIRAETLRRVTSNGRANFSQAAIILGISQPLVRELANLGKVQTIRFNNGIRYITLDELERLRSHNL